MVKKVTGWSLSPIELMRAVSSNFDENVLTIGGGYVALTSGDIPMTMLEEKARVLNAIPFTFGLGVSSSSDLLEQQNVQLRNENFLLRETIRRIEERLASIEASLPKEKTIILREVSKEEAEEEIRRLFSEGQILYYSDIAERLRLDLQLVVEICNELQSRGEIEVDDTIRAR
jgi:hypothetical protein